MVLSYQVRRTDARLGGEIKEGKENKEKKKKGRVRPETTRSNSLYRLMRKNNLRGGGKRLGKVWGAPEARHLEKVL